MQNVGGTKWREAAFQQGWNSSWKPGHLVPGEELRPHHKKVGRVLILFIQKVITDCDMPSIALI